MADYSHDMDKFFYRNKATLKRMAASSPYVTIHTYNSCSDAKVASTAEPTRTDFVYVQPGSVAVKTVPTGTPTIAPTLVPSVVTPTTL